VVSLPQNNAPKLAKVADTTIAERLLQELAEETVCPCCLDLFEDPRMLQCLHSCCFDCLTSLGTRDIAS